MLEKYLNQIVYLIELVVAAMLVLLSVLALFGLVLATWNVARESATLMPAQFTTVISLVLEVFILIELFRIALAYMSHTNVIPTVLEAALVAVARKFVIYEPKGDYLASAGGLAMLLLAVAIGWWLLARANACVLMEHVEEAH